MGQSDIRSYTVQAGSTGTFGRVQCSSRGHHFIVDGPIQNGCPGEAISPAELFLAGVAACGVELVQVIAKEQQLPLQAVGVEIAGKIDRGNPVRPDVTVFNSVQLQFSLNGVTQLQGTDLVERFKRR
jgi:uncharacterized OsmC-like protein